MSQLITFYRWPVLSVVLLLLPVLCRAQYPDTVQEIPEKISIAWMVAPLDVDHYRNGDPIFYAATADAWDSCNWQRRSCWCYNYNDSANGKYYNWYAVLDVRGLAPAGWHIPTTEEFALHDSLIKADTADNELTKHGPQGYPGCRFYDGAYNYKGMIGYWWSSTGGVNGNADAYNTYSDGQPSYINPFPKGYGMHVICIKDK